MKEKEDYQNRYTTGYRHRNFGHGAIGALILIAVGTIFLLNNLGLLPPDVWQNLWRFWPAILILIGLQMVLGKNIGANLIVLIVGLAFIGLIILLSLTPNNPQINSWVNQYMPGMMQRNPNTPWNYQNMNQGMYRHMYQYQQPGLNNSY